MQIGPFELKDLIICGVLLAVVTVAMFLLRQVLSFGLTIPMWMMVIAIMLVMVVVVLLVLTITRYLRYGSEGFLFATARRTGKAIYIDAELGSDIADFVIAEKPNPKDVVLKDEESGIKVDPSLLDSNARPMRFKGGLDCYIYSYYNFMPQTIRNHAAFAAIKNYFETKCPELSFLSVKEFVELISDPEHYLERNALIKLNKYFKISEKKDDQGETIYTTDNNGNLLLDTLGNKIPRYTYVRRYTIVDDQGVTKLVEQDISLPTMVNLLGKARQDISVLPIMGGLIAGTEAFKYNSVAYSSQHLGHVLMLYETKIRDAMKGMFDMMTVGIVALLVLCGTGFCIYIASMAFGKGG